MRHSNRGAPLIVYIGALAAALVIPCFVFSGLITWMWVSDQRERFAAQTDEIRDVTVAQLDRSLAGISGMLQALATSPALDDADLIRFDAQARQLVSLQGINIVLQDLAGQQVVNTRLPFGSKLPKGNPQTDKAVIETKRPLVSNLMIGLVSKNPIIAINVPVLRGDDVVYLLKASLPISFFSRILADVTAGLPHSSLIGDGTGRIVARSDGDESMVGRPVPGFDDTSDLKGRWSGISSQGVEVFSSYRRSPVSNWLVRVSLDQASINASLRRSEYLLATFAICLTILAVAASLFVLRRVLNAHARLTSVARLLDPDATRTGPMEVGYTGVKEVDDLGAVLVQASARLISQGEALEEANRVLEQRVAERTAALETSRGFLRATLDNMDQGLLVIDPDRRVPVISRRAVELVGLDPAMMEATPTIDEVIAHQIDNGELADEGVDDLPTVGPATDRTHTCERVHRYERERPNGIVLEVRTVMLGDGSAVRSYTDITERKNAERRIVESEARLRALTDALPQMVWVTSAVDGLTIFTNQRFRDYVGPIGPTRADRIGNHHPDDRTRVTREWEEAEREQRTFEIEERWQRSDGVFRWHKTILTPVRHDGAIVEWLGTALEIDEMVTAREALQASEARLRASEQRLAHALDAGSDGLWDRDIVTGETWYSDRWQTMLGYEPGELAQSGLRWIHLVHPEDRLRANRLLSEHLEGRTAIYECEHRLLTKGGRYSWVLARGKVVALDPDGRPARIVGTHIDIDARKTAEFQIAHMARHDALTDLPNRALFREQLNDILDRSDHGRPRRAVLCLDLDRFKAVNDTLGHLVGDAVLREVAQRLREVSPEGDTVARLGGDEFAMLVGSTSERETIAALADNLIDAIQRPMTIGGQQVEVGLSIGIAFAPDDGRDGETVFRRADTALYRAKADGRGTYRFFEDAMEQEVAERRDLEQDLRAAMKLEALELYYQPQMRCLTGEIVGYEALLRWRHPTRGFIPPSVFIPLAEETGLIGKLGEWALRQACREAAQWPQALKVAVNLSPRQFEQADLPDCVLAILTETGLAPMRLELEITETVIIQDVGRGLTLLRRLKGMGISIAMDDFGTGYSSLATLQSFPFDKIKIDRSFVGQVQTNVQAAAIVRAVLSLSRSLGIEAIAEGVETDEQMKFLILEGCGTVQGYLIGRPQPPAVIGESMRATLTKVA